MTTNDRVRLRPVEAGDLPRLYDLQLDPDSNRMAVTIPRTREAFDSHWAKSLNDPSITARVILVGGEMVGMISCFPRDGQDHVGYWIDRTFWGRGIASRALHLLLEEVAKRPLVATAATSNGASLRVLQKCGFVVEQVHLSPATDRHPECEEAVLMLREARTGRRPPCRVIHRPIDPASRRTSARISAAGIRTRWPWPGSTHSKR